MDIAIRSAKLEDLPTLYEFEQGLVNYERPMDKTLKDGVIHYYDLKELIESPESEVVVAVAETEVIGAGYIQIKKSKVYKKHDRHGYIGFMYVKPTHRGKGVIQLVTDAMLTWGKSQNVSEIKLEVYDKNESAVRAYEKAGFKKNLVEMRMEI